MDRGISVGSSVDFKAMPTDDNYKNSPVGSAPAAATTTTTTAKTSKHEDHPSSKSPPETHPNPKQVIQKENLPLHPVSGKTRKRLRTKWKSTSLHYTSWNDGRLRTTKKRVANRNYSQARRHDNDLGSIKIPDNMLLSTHDDPLQQELPPLEIPWDVVAPYCDEFADVLSLRATSVSIASILYESLTQQQCSIWLQTALVKHNVYLFNDTTQWMDAKQRYHDVSDDNDDDPDNVDNCFLGWLNNNHQHHHHHESTTVPFDQVLLCLRILKHVPQKLVVAYSPKYGRHCWGIDTNTKNNSAARSLMCRQYPHCHRKTNNCPTCRTKIGTETRPPPPNDTVANRRVDHPVPSRGRRQQWRIYDALQFEAIVQQQPLSPNSSEAKSTTERQQSRRVIVDLETYHNKCIPNLPSDLVCPCCRVNDRRTLVLSEFSYETEVSTQRHTTNAMSLTFTPSSKYFGQPVDHEYPLEPLASSLLDSSDDESSGDGNDHESGGDDDESWDEFTETNVGTRDKVPVPFPPNVWEGFFPSQFEHDPSHIKRGIAIYCQSCCQFGMLAPARPIDISAAAIRAPSLSGSTSKQLKFAVTALQR